MPNGTIYGRRDDMRTKLIECVATPASATILKHAQTLYENLNGIFLDMTPWHRHLDIKSQLEISEEIRKKAKGIILFKFSNYAKTC